MHYVSCTLGDAGGGTLAWDITFDQEISEVGTTFEGTTFELDGEPQLLESWVKDFLDPKVAHVFTTWTLNEFVLATIDHDKTDGDIKSVDGADCENFDDSIPNPFA